MLDWIFFLDDCPVTFLTGEEFHSSLRNQEKWIKRTIYKNCLFCAKLDVFLILKQQKWCTKYYISSSGLYLWFVHGYFLCSKLWSTAYRQDWLIYDGLFDIKNVIFMKKAIFWYFAQEILAWLKDFYDKGYDSGCGGIKIHFCLILRGWMQVSSWWWIWLGVVGEHFFYF